MQLVINMVTTLFEFLSPHTVYLEQFVQLVVLRR